MDAKTFIKQFKPQVGSHLFNIRKERDWTLAEVGGRINRTGSYVARIEKGQESPTFDTLFALIRIGLKMPIAEFFAPWSDGFHNHFAAVKRSKR